MRNYLYQIKSIGKYIKREDTEKLIKKVKEKHPEINIEIIQTRIKGRVVFEIKGDLEKSSKMIKELVGKLVG